MIHEAHSASRSPVVQPGVTVPGKGESADCYARDLLGGLARGRFGGRGAITGCGRSSARASERPRDRRTAEHRNHIASSHSITSSARSSSDFGIVRPSAFAV